MGTGRPADALGDDPEGTDQRLIDHQELIAGEEKIRVRGGGRENYSRRGGPPYVWARW